MGRGERVEGSDDEAFLGLAGARSLSLSLLSFFCSLDLRRLRGPKVAKINDVVKARKAAVL
jgi:hypothetical protein